MAESHDVSEQKKFAFKNIIVFLLPHSEGTSDDVSQVTVVK